MSTLRYPVVELRQYTLRPGQRDVLISLFDREFVESQEAAGMAIVGQFRDLDDPDRFVWIRGFASMPARATALASFYGGPVWKQHAAAANATMIDSDNVLLLRRVHPNSGFLLKNGKRPRRDSMAHDGFVAVTIYPIHQPATPDFIHYFENTIHPELMEADVSVLAYFVTEDSPNTFPQLPVREGESVFVWFAGFEDQDAYENYLARLEESKLWNHEISKFLKKHVRGKPEILRLVPTPRSWLRGKE